MYLFFFRVYLLGSGSIWTILGSWIRIRMKTYADPKHWSYKINLIIYILLFCLAECKIYSLLSPGTSLLGWYRWPTCSTWRRCRRSGRSSTVYRIYLCGAVCCALVCRSVCFRLRFYIGLLTKFIGQLVQCCESSGSGRIRNLFLDPELFVPDPAKL